MSREAREEIQKEKVLILRGLRAKPCHYLFLRRQLQDFGAHFLAGLEFHHGAGGNRHVRLRLVRIAADARLADFYVEHAEVAQFHLVPLGERFGDVVEGFLHHVKNLGLDQPGFLADADDNVSFGQGHGSNLVF